MTRRADLESPDPCVYRGHLGLPEDGRWFVYTAFGSGSQHDEAWLPVEVGGRTRASATRDLYEPPARSSGPTQVAVGALVAVVAAVILRGSLRTAATASPAAGARAGPAELPD